MDFSATCGAGFEQLVAAEVRDFQGQDITVSKGSVHWSGTLESGYRACLWSRFSSRVLLAIGEFRVEDEEELYEMVLGFPWDNHLSTTSTFAIDCSLAEGAPFKHSKYTALKIKDGVADHFRSKNGIRPNVRVDRPDVRINAHANRNRTVLSIDLSGESLHKRGYRLEKGDAPLKETLAAAIVALSGWDGKSPFIDPLCGSGTLLIEAAMMASDSAPGLGRSYFGLLGWRGHDPELWSRLISEAVEREEAGQNSVWPQLVGYDGDRLAVHQARKNIRVSGFEDRISVSRQELFNLAAPGETGCLVCNPPYGERLSDKSTVKYLYRSLGNRLQEAFCGWRIGLFTSNPDLADMTGLTWQNKYQLFNGPLSCKLFVGSVQEHQSPGFRWDLPAVKADEQGSDFANRLRKNARKFMGWADREGVECYRIYDRDMAEYNVAVDIYGKWVHVQEYGAPASVDPLVAAQRFQVVLEGVRQVLGVNRDRLYIKTRTRQKGKSQYRKKGSKAGKLYEVREGKCSLLVNFTDYLDTGLFLDNRNTRLRIGREAEGKRFLNLFGYTATATVHAVLGGAVSSTTVDLSRTYLQWAEKNFSLNGISPGRHKLVHLDCVQFLKEDKELYDLILVDPPTFSNTKKKSRIFDVQKDHVTLIDLAMLRLRQDGLLIFSTNYRSFRMESQLMERYSCRNISKKSVPRDFSNHSRIHQCWEFCKK